MPIHTIQVSEYECGHCGWKWINRINGKDRPIPLKCAKCKRLNWNDPLYDKVYDRINDKPFWIWNRRNDSWQKKNYGKIITVSVCSAWDTSLEIAYL